MITVLRENKRAPEDVARRLRLAGGLNRYGEANYRVVWGWSRLTWIAGKWTDRDTGGRLIREVVELRQVPKYFPHERWHLERWCAPELYGSPEQWYAQTLEVEGAHSIPALGPYPARGEYEHCFTLAGCARCGIAHASCGAFLPLTPSVVEHIARAIEFSRGLPAAARLSALREREARAERAYDRWAFDLLDDAAPAVHGLPFITVP